MNEASNVFVRNWGPRQWTARHLSSGIVATGESREQAEREFKLIWNERAPIRFVAEPILKREGEPREAEPKIEAESDGVKFRRALLSAFHSDHHGPDKRFSCDEIVVLINSTWAECAK